MKDILLDCTALTKTYNGEPVFRDLHLRIGQGEFIALLGPSGCGKTTLLKCIAGLEPLDKGTILLAGKDITRERAETRPVVMMFQEPLLFPHLTVAENIVYGLKIRGAGREALRQYGQGMLEKIDLVDKAMVFPYELSGGQQQRVALARALVVKPTIILLDEPFSSLDHELRGTIRSWVYDFLRGEGVTVLFVTHDREEAMMLGDQVAVMKDGLIQQIGLPLEVYHGPANKTVAQMFSDGLIFDQGFIPYDKIRLIPVTTPPLDLSYYQGLVTAKWIDYGRLRYKVALTEFNQEITVSSEQEFFMKEPVLAAFDWEELVPYRKE